MQIAVKDLIIMYENGKGNVPKQFKNISSYGKLHADMSTQREFIYNDIFVNDDNDNEITKAGHLIQSIIEKKIQLPALYFWNVQDNEKNIHYDVNEFNIHDGKQRFLSIYNFIKGSNGNRVSTRINGEECLFGNLTPEQQEYLMNYNFDIVIRQGTCKEEEESFYLLNTTAEPLRRYEGLRGAYHGKYLYEFENYIDNLKLDRIKKVGRGEQAEYLLYMALGIIDDDTKFLLTNAKRLLTAKRYQSFDRNENFFDEKVNLYNEFVSVSNLKGGSDEKNRQKLARIVNYIVNHKYNKTKILDYYRSGFKTINDIDKWKFETHRIAIDNLMKGIVCDYRRYFNNEEKGELFKKSNICGKCGKSFGFSEFEVDHVIPWSEGGLTDIQNAQLLCKSCNCKKGSN